MVQGREAEKKNIRHAVETLKMVWDEMSAQFAELSNQERIMMCDVFINMTQPHTISMPADDESEAKEEQYEWVKKEKAKKNG